MGIKKIKAKVVNSQQEFAKSRFNPYSEGGIREWNATGAEERMRITLSGNPSFIWWYPNKKPIKTMTAGTIKNLIPAIKIDSFWYCLALFNLMERPIEINSKTVLTGIKREIIVV